RLFARYLKSETSESRRLGDGVLGDTTWAHPAEALALATVTTIASQECLRASTADAPRSRVHVCRTEVRASRGRPSIYVHPCGRVKRPSRCGRTLSRPNQIRRVRCVPRMKVTIQGGIEAAERSVGRAFRSGGQLSRTARRHRRFGSQQERTPIRERPA